MEVGISDYVKACFTSIGIWKPNDERTARTFGSRQSVELRATPALLPSTVQMGKLEAAELKSHAQLVLNPGFPIG